MIPLRDNIHHRRTPWATWLIILANALVFAYELKLGDGLAAFFLRYGLVPWNLTRGMEANGFDPAVQVVPWFSSMFLHGGWMHVIGNMWFLYIFGDNVEDCMGPGRFVVFYLLGGLCAGAAQVAVSPLSQIPMVGASGAVSAVLAAYVVCYPRARIVSLVPLFIILYFTELPAWLFIGIWFLIQYFQGTAALSSSLEGGVAWWAHIGGFVAGIPLLFVLRRDRGSPQRRERPGTLTVIRARRR